MPEFAWPGLLGECWGVLWVTSGGNGKSCEVPAKKVFVLQSEKLLLFTIFLDFTWPLAPFAPQKRHFCFDVPPSSKCLLL